MVSKAAAVYTGGAHYYLYQAGGSLQLGTDKQQTKEYRVHECSLLDTE